MLLSKMTFLGEEIIVKRIKVTKQQAEDNVFSNSGMASEKSNYGVFEVVKVGKKQLEVKAGDKVTINNNGLNDREITVDGYSPLVDHYALMNTTRIFSLLDE